MNVELIEGMVTHCGFHVGNEHYDKPSEEQQRIFIEAYTREVILECQKALSPMLRDMISRGHAVELIKQHFGVQDDRLA